SSIRSSREVMQFFAKVLIAVLVVCSTWWSIRRMLRLHAPAEPAEEPFAEDPFANVSAPLKPSPKGRAGAIAMEEPDDDIADAFPPRML
ncbi:MAG: hypothetical protein ACRD3P_13775, partial [Terriglobales bacterium]